MTEEEVDAEMVSVYMDASNLIEYGLGGLLGMWDPVEDSKSIEKEINSIRWRVKKIN